MPKINNYDKSCQYNNGVVCEDTTKECGHCSWNPVVAKARLEQYYRMHNIIPAQNDQKEHHG